MDCVLADLARPAWSWLGFRFWLLLGFAFWSVFASHIRQSTVLYALVSSAILGQFQIDSPTVSFAEIALTGCGRAESRLPKRVQGFSIQR
jgi:hypothetical protein